MAETLTVTVVGDQQVAFHLTEVSRRIALAVHREMTAIGLRLAKYVKLVKLSGDPLHVRTGHLRQSVTSQTRPEGTSVVTEVGIFKGPTVVYGRAHEFGVDREVQVRAHLRQVKSRTFRYAGTTVVGTTAVGAYTYHMKLPVRSWLRTAFAENREAILAVLRATVAAAIRGARGATA